MTVHLLDFTTAAYLYSPDSTRLRYVKKVWDNFHDTFIHEVQLQAHETCLARINQSFKATVPAAARWRPLGDFKDYDDIVGLTHEKVYTDFVAAMTEVRPWVTRKGKGHTTYLKVCHHVYTRAYASWEEKHFLPYSDEIFEEGISLMLYWAAKGVVDEVRTIEHAAAVFAEEGVVVVPAPASDEGKDIDCYLEDNTGKRLPVSIKNGRALGGYTIQQKRGKGKTKPAVYMGFDQRGSFAMLTPTATPASVRDVVEKLREGKNHV